MEITTTDNQKQKLPDGMVIQRVEKEAPHLSDYYHFNGRYVYSIGVKGGPTTHAVASVHELTDEQVISAFYKESPLPLTKEQ